MVLNLHGLYGTAENTNYRILTELYPVPEIYSPQIAFEKRSPYNIIDGLYAVKDIDFIVGNSFGGFYAYAMGAELNIPCLLTNPCIPPAKYIRELVPEYPESSLHQLRELTEPAYTKRLHETSCSTFVILGKDDDILDSKFTKKYLKNAEIHEIDGKHRLSGEGYRKLFKELIHHRKYFTYKLELK